LDPDAIWGGEWSRLRDSVLGGGLCAPRGRKGLGVFRFHWFGVFFKTNVFDLGVKTTTTTTTTTTISQPPGLCPGLPGLAGTRKVKPVWIYWSKR